MAFVPVPNCTIRVWSPTQALTEPPDWTGIPTQQLKPYIEYESRQTDAPPAARNFIYRFFCTTSDFIEEVGPFVAVNLESWYFQFEAHPWDEFFIITGFQAVLDFGEIQYAYFTAISRRS